MAIVILVVLPVGLYFIIAEQISWRPRTIAVFSQRRNASWVAFSPKGDLVAFATMPDGYSVVDTFDEISLWNVSQGKVLWHKSTMEGAYGPGVFMPDGKIIALDGERMNLWDVKTGKLNGVRGSGGFTSIAAHDNLVAEGSNASPVFVWDVSKHSEDKPSEDRPLAALGSDADYTHTVIFSPDGKTLVSGGYRSIRTGVNIAYIALWDTRTWKLRRLLKGLEKSPSSLAFSPNGKELVSWSPGEINWWNPQSRRLILKAKLKSELNNYGTAAFSSDTNIVAICKGKTITLRDARTGVLLRTLRGHRGEVNSLSFSSDGTTLVSGSMDSSVKLWREIASERETAYLLKSEAMKKRLLEAKNRSEGVSLEDVRAQLGI